MMSEPSKRHSKFLSLIFILKPFFFVTDLKKTKQKKSVLRPSDCLRPDALFRSASDRQHTQI